MKWLALLIAASLHAQPALPKEKFGPSNPINSVTLHSIRPLIWDWADGVIWDVQWKSNLAGPWMMAATNLITNRWLITNNAPMKFFRVGAQWATN